MDYYTLLSMMVDFREFGLMEAVASSRRDTAVIEMAGRLAENGTGKEKKQSIALLATLSPQELKSNMSLIVQVSVSTQLSDMYRLETYKMCLKTENSLSYSKI